MAARTNDSALLLALTQPSVSAFLLCEIYFTSGTARLTTLPHEVTWNGNTYYSTRNLADIEPLAESSSSIMGLKFTLSGVNPADIAETLTERVQGRKVVLHLAVLDAGTLRVDQNIWKGSLDTRELVPVGDSATITVTAEHKLISWNRASGLESSPATQQGFVDEGDLFFQHAAINSTRIIVWPSKEAQTK